MSEYPRARFVFLTDLPGDETILNIQEEGKEDILRFEMTRDQLFGLNAKAADILLNGQR